MHILLLSSCQILCQFMNFFKQFFQTLFIFIIIFLNLYFYFFIIAACICGETIHCFSIDFLVENGNLYRNKGFHLFFNNSCFIFYRCIPFLILSLRLFASRRRFRLNNSFLLNDYWLLNAKLFLRGSCLGLIDSNLHI